MWTACIEWTKQQALERARHWGSWLSWPRYMSGDRVRSWGEVLERLSRLQLKLNQAELTEDALQSKSRSRWHRHHEVGLNFQDSGHSKPQRPGDIDARIS
jgi:hypothetical protein